MIKINEKKSLVFLLVSVTFFSLINYAYALDVKITEVEITTAPLRDVVVTFYKVGTEEIIQQFNEKSYVEGKVNFKFYSIESNFDYEVKVLFGDKEVASEKFENKVAKTPITLTIGLDDKNASSEDNDEATVINSSNEDIPEDSESGESSITAEQKGDNQNVVSGAAIIGADSKIESYWYFIAVGALGLGLLGFLVTKRIYASHGTEKGNFVPPKSIQRSIDPSKPVISPKEDDLDKRVANAEARIQEAQKELKSIKEQEKIRLAERKIQKDTQELDRLRKQQDSADSEKK